MINHNTDKPVMINHHTDKPVMIHTPFLETNAMITMIATMINVAHNGDIAELVI